MRVGDRYGPLWNLGMALEPCPSAGLMGWLSPWCSLSTAPAGIHDLEVRIIDAATGELLRDLVIDLSRNYQPQNKRP